MIDKEGYRANVCAVVSNGEGGVLWARRARGGRRPGWQFPQGGMAVGETPEQALYRELHEEVGLQAADVQVLSRTRDWLRYDLPKKYVRKGGKVPCIGQKQLWFLVSLETSEDRISLDHAPEPEFDRWRWVPYWQPTDEVVAFKREVYRRALAELESPFKRHLSERRR